MIETMFFKLKNVVFSLCFAFGPCILSENIFLHEKLEPVMSYFLCIHTFLCATDRPNKKSMHTTARKINKYLQCIHYIAIKK